MANRFTMPVEQAINDDASGSGSGWKLDFFITGTSTRKDTFSDNALTVANTNPVVADSSGRFGDIFLEDGTYKVVLKDDLDVVKWTADPVTGSLGTGGEVDAKTAAYTVVTGDASKLINMDATTGALTVTLLAAATATNGFEVSVKKTDSSANAVTIDGNGAETIDGATTHVLTNQNDNATLRCNGSNWFVVARTRGIATQAETDAGTDDSRIVTPLKLANLPLRGRNTIINGAMNVKQRGASFTGVGASATEYTLDRWLVYTSGAPQARATVTQETTGVFGGFGNSAKIDCTTVEAAVAATELWSWQQRIEAQDLQFLRYGNAAAKTLSLTFQIKSPKSGTHCVALYQPDGARSFVREFTVAAANTAEEITVTFPGDASGTINNDTGEGLRLTWPLVAGANFQVAADAWAAGEDYATSNQQNLLDNVANNFEITGIQLELGFVSTPFERRSFGQELALCNRYYYKTFPQATAPAQNAGVTGAYAFGQGAAGAVNFAYPSSVFPVVMRAAPTMTGYNPSAANAQARNTTDNSNYSSTSVNGTEWGWDFSATGPAGGSVGQLSRVHVQADAEL